MPEASLLRASNQPTALDTESSVVLVVPSAIQEDSQYLPAESVQVRVANFRERRSSADSGRSLARSESEYWVA
jgi:hypothetical protein